MASSMTENSEIAAILDKTAVMTVKYKSEQGEHLSYVWYHSGENGEQCDPIVTNHNGRYSLNTNNGNLTITNVKLEDEGYYLCIVISSNASTPPAELTYLAVHYAPEIEQLSNMQVSHGDEVVIKFDVVANPAATYTWTTTPAITDTDSNPETYTFTVSDHCVKTYTVTLEATNEVGVDKKSVEVNVDPDLSAFKKVAVIVLACITVLGIIFVIYCYYAKKLCFSKNRVSTSDPGPTDVEMDKAEGKSDLERYQASGGEMYTQVNLQQKKKKPESDNGSNKPAPVDLNAEGLQYADLDLTRNCPAGKQDVINHPDSETMYSSIQTHQI